MSSTSSVEHFSNVPHPAALFDAESFGAEEETYVPPVSLGYSNPPAPAVPSARPAPQMLVDDEAIIDAALGAHRRQLAMVTLGLSGLVLGVVAALAL